MQKQNDGNIQDFDATGMLSLHFINILSENVLIGVYDIQWVLTYVSYLPGYIELVERMIVYGI